VQQAFQAVFLILMLAALSRRLQTSLREWIQRRGWRIWLGPMALAAGFWIALYQAGAASLAALIFPAMYVALPTLVVILNRGRSPGLDFLAILGLWLPLEFPAVAGRWIPRAGQPIAYEIAQGAAVTLALLLFLVYQNLGGMKYNLPNSRKDLLNPLVGFAAAALLLIPLGRGLCFLGPFRLPEGWGLTEAARTLPVILLGVALPEELLFRSLIQNRLMQCLGESNRTLLAAALIFGAAHLNNGPQPLPNWRYMILATIAGFIYGKVFQKSSSVLSSALLHALVNTVRRVFFL
jgi:membrane protease YdiL (CAAX protease family)